MAVKEKNVLLNLLPATIAKTRDPFAKDIIGITVSVNKKDANRFPDVVKKLEESLAGQFGDKNVQHFFTTHTKSIEKFIEDLRADGFEIADVTPTP